MPLPPPGYVVISVPDLAQLLGQRAAAAAPAQPATDPLAAAVAMLTAGLYGTHVDPREVLGDTDPQRVAFLLTVIAVTLIRGSLSDHAAESLLRDLGELAAGLTP